MDEREQVTDPILTLGRWKSFQIAFVSKYAFRWLVSVLVASGFIVGYWLSRFLLLRTYKLLNLVGLVLALLGVLVLSEILANDLWKAFCVNWIAPTVLWILSVTPSGAALGGFAAVFTHKPSAYVVLHFSIELWGGSILALGPFNDIVVFPKYRFLKKDVETRWRWMGFLLVLGGILAQLLAAILDLTS